MHGCMYMKMITRDFVMGWVCGLLYILQISLLLIHLSRI